MATRVPMEELIRRLRAGDCEPDALSLADAVWLSRWVDGSSTAPDASGTPHWAPSGRPPGLLAPTGHEGERRDDVLDAPKVAPPRHVPPAALSAPGSLPGLLGMQRALRPLQRHRGAARSATAMLDEDATAELTASTGITVPVFRGGTRRASSLQLLFDSSSSMVVWERAAKELTEVFARIGAFHDVRRYQLHQAEDGTLLVATGRGTGERPRPAWAALDPTSRTFTLLISDCAGPLWRSGAAQRFLNRLAAHRAPVAVLQPLPQRLWSRTALLPGPGMIQLRGRDGLECAFIPDGAPLSAGEGALPVPVLPPWSQALGRWARLLTGTGPTRVKGAAAWVRADHPPVPAADGPRRTAHELLARFRADASPTAQRLAVYLAAAPLALPVMLLVQQAMMKGESGPTELAEVLLGGILSHANPAGTQGETWYDFAPGVRDLLLGSLARDEAALVLKHCSEYVETHFGRHAPNFPALALAQLSGSESPAVFRRSPSDDISDADGVPAPFAAVSAEVVRRFMPTPQPPRLSSGEGLVRARELISNFERERDGWALVEAVDLLRDLVAGSAGARTGEAEAELAGALLALYQLESDPALLSEGRRVVLRCLGRPSTPTAPWEGTARLTLGRLLRESARLRQTAGDTRGAEACLEDANRELVRAARQLAPDTGPGLKVVLERADVLHELWRSQGDQALLHEAAGALRAIGGAQSFWAPRTADLHIQLGQVLLDIAGTTPARARQYATDAAEELAAARDVLAAEPDGPARMTALLMDLARARETGGADGTVVLRTLEEAERAAEFAPDMRVPVLLRMARTHRARYEAGQDPGALRQASEAFDRAAVHAREGDPERSALMEEWGETLLDMVGLEGGEEVANRAVEVLGDAARGTVGSGPATVRRYLLLGRALQVRFARTDENTDLRDVVQALAHAARAEGPPGIHARACYELGRAEHELAWRTRDFALLHEVAEHWRQAVREAREADDRELGALADDAYQELRAQLAPPAGAPD
ncbi:SAV_2336 N-terminal domain-related protein [Streptomyces sp. NBC_00878]|uniref:SAV_2336 N-terminal domain-related protein n=1 Tax=Streptomyces sp. NBC_00878 TaxID=2975854 RepID=UPI00224D4AA5|nr:SAV_2336 N-terminal domain-related protein [Streptomyces sp. NBC_00878]MCX4905497.1 SAV_2336 N-terminal domain-related protein [Streptomyces sp. NBC_00878]